MPKDARASLEKARQLVHLTGKVNFPCSRLAEQGRGKRFNQRFPKIPLWFESSAFRGKERLTRRRSRRNPFLQLLPSGRGVCGLNIFWQGSETFREALSKFTVDKKNHVSLTAGGASVSGFDRRLPPPHGMAAWRGGDQAAAPRGPCLLPGGGLFTAPEVRLPSRQRMQPLKPGQMNDL